MLRALAGRLELERFVSFSCLFPELSGSIPGKAEKTCELQRQEQNEHIEFNQQGQQRGLPPTRLKINLNPF